MLTTILRFSPVLQVAVGPRFDALQPYNRPGLSLFVKAAQKIQLPQFSHMADARVLVQARAQSPKGVVKASATVPSSQQTYFERDARRMIPMASATVVGASLKQNFGSVE